MKFVGIAHPKGPNGERLFPENQVGVLVERESRYVRFICPISGAGVFLYDAGTSPEGQPPAVLMMEALERLDAVRAELVATLQEQTPGRPS